MTANTTIAHLKNFRIFSIFAKIPKIALKNALRPQFFRPFINKEAIRERVFLTFAFLYLLFGQQKEAKTGRGSKKLLRHSLKWYNFELSHIVESHFSLQLRLTLFESSGTTFTTFGRD
jgi:hypothetical protein